MHERGKYIVIEGNDGTGKSTQVALLREKLTADGIESVEFHEPDGTPIANEIRRIIKNGELERDAKTNLLLFTAARHEIWNSTKQLLNKGTWIIAARNYYSTLAYQGYGEGLDLKLIKDTTEAFTDPIYCNPDAAFILHLPSEETRRERLIKRGEATDKDTFESMNNDFQVRVNQGYHTIAADYTLPLINADSEPEAVAAEIYSALQQNKLF